MNTLSVALLVALAISGVYSNDIRVGTDNGRIVFNETIQASPAIWRQVQKITVNVSDHEVVSSVKVTDNRPEKDGEAQIVEGGEGQKNVTLELKSPTVFRGFDFHVVVYAVQDNGQPIMTQDVDVNSSAKPENQDNVDSVKDNVDSVTEYLGLNTEMAGTGEKNDGPISPAVAGQNRLYRDTEDQTSDPVVKYVTEKNEESTLVTLGQKLTVSEQEMTTVPAINHPALSADDTPSKAGENSQGTIKDAEGTAKNTEGILIDGEGTTKNSEDTAKNIEGTIPTSENAFSTSDSEPAAASSTEKTHDNMNMNNFDGISKELGQKVVFGIKKH